MIGWIVLGVIIGFCAAVIYGGCRLEGQQTERDRQAFYDEHGYWPNY